MKTTAVPSSTPMMTLSARNLLKFMVHYWLWFLLSVVICLCASMLYVWYTTPVYKLSGRMLIQQADNVNGRGSSNMFRYVNNIGSVSRTAGVENEVERLWSSMLMRDVVKSLKLYTDYRVKGWPKNRVVYATQPVTVDLDPLHLDSIDKMVFDEYCTINMKMKRKGDSDTILVMGILMSEDEMVWGFNRRINSLPYKIDTPFGTLTFTKNPQGEELKAGQEWSITIQPPYDKALEYLGRLGVNQRKEDQNSDRWLFRYYYKMSDIVSVTFVDRDIRRGMDVLRQLAVSYNRLANEEKNEVARRTEAFINERIASLSEELNLKDDSIEQIKREGGLTDITDAAKSVVQADKLGMKMTEAGTQRMMIDYLDEYVRNPKNKYEIIPSIFGLDNKVSENMIGQYNEIVQERKWRLQSASEESPEVKRLEIVAEEMRAAIRKALQQARHASEIEQRGLGLQYATFREKVDVTPVAEKALADVGRQQAIKDRLFRLLLQKREENSITLTSNSNHGRLIDEPMLSGRVRPNRWKAYGIALGVGIAVPYAILFLLGLLRWRIRDRKELEKMTERPIVAELPMIGDHVKGDAGIVVRFGVNEPVTETFRLLRTNVLFMLKGEGNAILVTSSTSGEGKTFCAANLAMSFALLEKRVILCGMDIRRPALGKLFEHTDRNMGLSVLLGMDHVTETDVNRHVQPSGISRHLDLLQAGPVPPNPAELLSRDVFGEVVGILKKEYDYVIFDTAPVGLVTDTLTIGRQADVTIFVCRAGYTPRYAIAQLNQFAEEDKLPNTCFVLNGQYE